MMDFGAKSILGVVICAVAAGVGSKIGEGLARKGLESVGFFPSTSAPTPQVNVQPGAYVDTGSVPVDGSNFTEV